MLTFTCRMLYHLAKGFVRPPVLSKNKTVDFVFRCTPVDIDVYGHMNNACYLRVAELARWGIFPASGMLESALKTRMMFLAVEQNIIYKRPIPALEKYVISTKCDIYDDDKWVHYTHTFLEHPDKVQEGQAPRVFAEIKLRAVMKEASGKTVKPSSIAASASELTKGLFEAHKVSEKENS